MNLKRYSIFLLDRETDCPDAKLRFRVKWSGGIAAFSLGYRVDVDKWIADAQRCRQSTTHGVKKISASVINREIQRYASAADSVFDAYEKADKVPLPSEFRDAFNLAIGKTSRVSQPAEEDFFAVFDRFVSSMGSQNAWSTATFTKWDAIKNHLQSFDPNLNLTTLSDQTLQSFVGYLHGVPLRNTTIAKNVSFVRWFLRWCYNNDLYSGKSHETFRPKLKGTDGNSKEVVHLSWDELIHMLKFRVPTSQPHLARVRDVFCFCCFTGLRYSDVAKLRRSDIRGDCIWVVTQKTVDGLKIELNKYSRSILEKYAKFPFPDDLALPVISNAKMNEHLKELGEMVDLVEPQRIVYFMGSVRHEEVFPKWSVLTTHCARRTFIVNALYLGIPSEVVMRWTGHSDYKAMKPYIKIVDKLKVQEMAKFDR